MKNIAAHETNQKTRNELNKTRKEKGRRRKQKVVHSNVQKIIKKRLTKETI